MKLMPVQTQPPRNSGLGHVGLVILSRLASDKEPHALEPLQSGYRLLATFHDSGSPVSKLALYDVPRAYCKWFGDPVRTIPSARFGSAAERWKHLVCGRQPPVQLHSKLLPTKSFLLPGCPQPAEQRICWRIPLGVGFLGLTKALGGVPGVGTL